MKGIDVPIEKQRLIFNDHLWTGFNCSWNGRCQVNYRDEKTVPEVLVSGSDYKDVLLDDSKDAISFFYVQPERTIDEATVEIYFAVKLPTLYPLVTERATEYALLDAIDKVKRGSLFSVTGIVDGYESWRTFGMVKKEDNMQPFYLFKLITKLQYSLTC